MPVAGRSRLPSWLTRNVVVLSGVSLLQDTASELLYPVLPIFLTTVLGAPPVVVGAVEGVADGAAAASKWFAGRAADHRARRPMIAIGYGLAAVGKVLIAMATIWPMVLLARVVDRIGKGMRSTPRDALLMVDVEPSRRGAVFGVHRAADTTGAVMGPLLGLALYEGLGQRLRPLFWVAVIPAVASVALVALVAEHRSTTSHLASPERASARATPGPDPAGRRPTWRELPRPARRAIGVLALFAILNFPDSLLLLRAHQAGLGTAMVILAYVIYNLVYALASYPAGALSDRLPRRRVFGIGLAFFAIGYLGLGSVHETWQIFVVLALYGGFAACTDGVGKAWISSLVPAGAQGTAQGLYQGLSGAGVLLAGIWAGLLWGSDGRVPLLISGFGAVAFAVVFLGPMKARTREQSVVSPEGNS